jgi:hypothetical protein
MRLLEKITHMAEGLNNAPGGIDKRLLEIFGEDQCLKWKKENPDFLRYQCFELECGFALEEMSKILNDGHTIEDLESFDPVNFPVDEMELISLGVFNPMRYNVRRSYISRKYYKMGNTSKVLVLYSGEELRKIFNSHVA